MATNPNTGGIRPVTPSHIPPYVAFFPEPATAQSRFLIQGYVDRSEIAAAVEALVDLLDTIDGDPDLEGECSEDEVSRCADDGHASEGDGPGCEIADPSGMNDEDGINTQIIVTLANGPGCRISDDDGCCESGHWMPGTP